MRWRRPALGCRRRVEPRYDALAARIARRGAGRWLAQDPCGAVFLPRPGFRSSHLGLLLARHEGRIADPLAKGTEAAERRHLAAALLRAAPRLTGLQLLIAVTVAARLRLAGNVQSALFPHLRKPGCGDAWKRHVHRVVAMLEALADLDGEARSAGALGVVQHVAVHLAEHIEAYGKHALAALCALGRAGGNRALQRLGEGGSACLVDTVARAVLAVSEDGLGEVRAVDAADLFRALTGLGHRDAELHLALSRHLADHLDELDPKHLPVLGRAVGPTSRNVPSEDFVLLHALCRRSTAAMGELEGPSVVALLQIFGRCELYDEEFLEAASEHLLRVTGHLPASQLGDVMYAFGSLQVRDIGQLDALCEALRPRVRDIGEGDLVRFMKGLVKLRHCNEDLLLAFEPVIESLKWTASPVSLTNLISSLSYFDITREEFFKSLLHAAISRVSRLTPMSIQHMLTALCRRQGRMDRQDVEAIVTKICIRLTEPGLAANLTPIQAVASLTALAKLQHQDLSAAAVLTSVLAGHGADVVWSWAPSAHFYAHSRRPCLEVSGPQRRGVEVLWTALDNSHCVDVLQSLQRLDLHSALTTRLALQLCGRLVPQLHELRAREVLVVARSLSAGRLPGDCDRDIPSGVLLNTGAAGAAVVASAPAEELGSVEAAPHTGAPASWRERVVDSCFESLRRHEHFLESSWNTLLPFKLLCMEIDAETYGSRRLCDVLSPSLLSFVERLRQLTRAECEANRLRREGAEEQDEELGAAASTAAAKSALALALATGTAPAPTVQEFPQHRVFMGGHIHDLPVDVLICNLA